MRLSLQCIFGAHHIFKKQTWHLYFVHTQVQIHLAKSTGNTRYRSIKNFQPNTPTAPQRHAPDLVLRYQYMQVLAHVETQHLRAVLQVYFRLSHHITLQQDRWAVTCASRRNGFEESAPENLSLVLHILHYDTIVLLCTCAAVKYRSTDGGNEALFE